MVKRRRSGAPIRRRSSMRRKGGRFRRKRKGRSRNVWTAIAKLNKRVTNNVRRWEDLRIPPTTLSLTLATTLQLHPPTMTAGSRHFNRVGDYVNWLTIDMRMTFTRVTAGSGTVAAPKWRLVFYYKSGLGTSGPGALGTEDLFTYSDVGLDPVQAVFASTYLKPAVENFQVLKDTVVVMGATQSVNTNSGTMMKKFKLNLGKRTARYENALQLLTAGGIYVVIIPWTVSLSGTSPEYSIDTQWRLNWEA